MRASLAPFKSISMQLKDYQKIELEFSPKERALLEEIKAIAKQGNSDLATTIKFLLSEYLNP